MRSSPCRQRILALALPLIATLVALANLPRGRADTHTHRLDAPIPTVGTLTFKLHTGHAWQNGARRQKLSTPFIKIPKIADGSLGQTEPAVAFVWRFTGGPRLQSLVPELPGAETWHVQVTWDAAGGAYDLFVNGFALTTPGVRYEPWTIAESATQIQTFDGPLEVSNLSLQPGYLTPDAALARTPAELRGRHANLFGKAEMPPPIEVRDRRGQLLVDVPLGSAEEVRDWVLEGPGEITFPDGWMQMRSTRPDASGDLNGHVVYWCPRDFPASFVCDWEVRIVSDFGLNIIFFAAKGENGEEIFDPALPERDGTFTDYIRRAVKSYHISYYASTPGTPGRAMSNLRKNNKFFLISTGPVAIPDDSRDVHRMRLIKDGAHIQLQVDGRVSIDYTDSGGDRYGPVYTDGKIGLRQMQWTIGQYRNFRVWELKRIHRE